jgi:alkylation response protein AidB-like acyl-CoA dehydrogenase
MSTTQTEPRAKPTLARLPGDAVRRIMWRFQDREDLHRLVDAARDVARGPVARLVAQGGRHSLEWTPRKAELFEHFDAAGLSTMSIDPEFGGYLEGPKNLAMALATFELAWVDGGAATSSMASHLALAPIHERGTREQMAYYMGKCIPAKPGEDRMHWRGAFALTEPLPFVGVQTRMLEGRVSVEKWDEGQEPLLRVAKRGRFITNMDVATFVVAAVDSADDRFKGSCMIILEKGDPGRFDLGEPSLKLVHQLSSTRDPIFDMVVPAGRIVGGYTVADGVIVPNFSHSDVIFSVFRRTRVTVGLMTSSKLISAVEPVIRYHRNRFRGGPVDAPGTPRYEMGLQQKEDVLHRLVDVWATGEAGASLGFATARFFDTFDDMDHRRDAIMKEHGIPEGRAGMKELLKMQEPAVELVKLAGRPHDLRDQNRYEELQSNELVRFLVGDAMANILCPACKLWNTGHGANMMREAVSLMGGMGITEDCPGFLGQKWMDAQLEATYEGPEAVQRRQLSLAMPNEIFLSQFQEWIHEMRNVAGRRPDIGACNLASAMELWLWTIRHLQKVTDADGKPLYRAQRQGVTFPMADALCWILASRFQILDVLELARKGPEDPEVKKDLPGFVQFFTDLCHVQASRAAGEVTRICSELVFGYNRHPSWEEDAYTAEEVESMEGMFPGIVACAQGRGEVVEADGSHPAKRGPCVHFKGVEAFVAMRTKLGGCGTGAGLAKDRAAGALTTVAIPEELDYPR